MSRHLLVVGLPRSGTTWLCNVLQLGKTHELLLEPDNEKESWPAWRLKRHLPRYPTLTSAEQDPCFRYLWEYAFHGRGARQACRGLFRAYFKLRRKHVERHIAFKEQRAANAGSAAQAMPAAPAALDRLLWGNRRATTPRIVKSVHGAFCIEWIVQQVQPAHVIVILRHPLSTIASMRRLGMYDAFRLGSLSPHLTESERTFVNELLKSHGPPHDVRLVALQVMKMYEQLRAAAQRHSTWTTIQFEDLCASPVEAYRTLFEEIELPWLPSYETQLTTMNQPGSGFETRRIAEQQIDTWKRELSSADLAAIESLFPNIATSHQRTIAHGK